MNRAILMTALFLALGSALRADTVELKGGTSVEGEVISFDGKTLKVRSRIGAGVAEVPYPLERIAKVVLAVPAPLAAAIAEPTAQALPVLEEAWKQRQSMLALPETHAGQVGQALARALLSTGKKRDAQAALELIELLRDGDWNAGRRDEAVRLRLTALAAAGKVEQAMEEASRLEQIGGGDESALAAARVRTALVKAGLAWKKLRKLEEEWPKWRDMPEQRADHSRLVQEALDGFVFAAVFHPELRDLAAEGLWNAAEAYLHLGQPELAGVAAREIVDHFPAPEFQPRAAQLLQKTSPTPKAKAKP